MIRKANIDEVVRCGELIYKSGSELFEYVYNTKEPEIYRLFDLMYRDENTTFSHNNSLVYIEGDALAGLMIALPAKELKNSTKYEFASFLKFKKGLTLIKYLIILLTRLRLVAFYPRLNNDEYFISNIAVYEKFRGRGIASRLLNEAESKAKKLSLNKLSLFVEIDNEVAINVYKKKGFYREETSIFPKKYNRYGLKGFSKMVKII